LRADRVAVATTSCIRVADAANRVRVAVAEPAWAASGTAATPLFQEGRWLLRRQLQRLWDLGLVFTLVGL
jgi:hypothetical protein